MVSFRNAGRHPEARRSSAAGEISQDTIFGEIPFGSARDDATLERFKLSHRTILCAIFCATFWPPSG